MSEPTIDVVGIGNALVDVISHETHAFVEAQGLVPGSMNLIETDRRSELYGAMGVAIETSGGSVANTMAGIASFGGSAHYLGRVRDDQLGEVFAHDMAAVGVGYTNPLAIDGPPTGCCLVWVTDDGQRTMNTYLGSAELFGTDDVDAEVVASGRFLYLEGYLFDRPEAQAAFRLAATMAHAAGRTVSMTLSDSFCVDRHRDDWLELTQALLMTALKVAGVLVIATLWTVPVGLWIGQRQRVATWAEPIIQNIAAFPAPVLYPLIVFTIAGFGLPAGIVAMILMTIGNQWYMLFNVLSGASRISPDLMAVARIYRFSRWKKFTKLYLPAIFPSLLTGWISAAGGAWNASIVAEMVTYPGGTLEADGIGAEITRATEQGNFPRLVAAIIVITIALVVINRSLWRTLHEHVELVK